MARTITVKGTGLVSTAPDYVMILLTLETTEKLYCEMMAEATKSIERLRDAVVKAGFKKDDLKTTSFSVDTKYESEKRYDHYERVFKGYSCEHSLKLAFDFESGRLSDALSAIADSGEHPDMRIRFTVKDSSQVSAALLEDATRNAREKAEILCQASNAQLGHLLNIDYNWGELDVYSSTQYEMADDCVPMMVGGKCPAPDIDPEDIKVSDTVTFVWEIS